MSESLSEFTGKLNVEVVEVCGIKFKVGEFDMRTRALWLDVAKSFNLQEAQHEIQTRVIPRISSLGSNIESDPRVKSVEARLDKLQEKHDALVAVYATEDEPEDIDAQLNAILDRMSAIRDEYQETLEAVQQEIFHEAQEAERIIAEFMETQDKARAYFAWQMGTAMGKTDLEFDEFYSRCESEDYIAAERLVAEGNARWASLYSNRMQTKPKRKNLN